MQKADITLPILGTIASWRLIFVVVGLPGLLFSFLVFTVLKPLRKSLALAADGAANMNLKETFRQVSATDGNRARE